MDYLGELKAKIKLLHGCEATHRQTVPVREVFPGKMVWDGEVEVFDVTGNAKTKHCYAWGSANERNPDRLDVVAVLEIPPVISPETAVKAAITFCSKELAMNRIRMVVIDEPNPNTRTVLVSSKDSAPPIRGNGAITYVCGKCAFPIVKNVNPEQKSDIVFKCPYCGSFNDWSASVSSHN